MCDLINIYPDIPTSLRFGFDMGVSSKLMTTYTPPNHSSSLLSPDAIDAHIKKELSLRRYTGPFSRSRLELIIGPFRSSPLGTVDKAGSSGELRVIQDLSFPRSDPFISSVNAEIDISNFQCTWGSFHEVCLMVITAPPGTEAATLDVDSAFRCCPILPSQRPHFIIGWKNLFYIDHNAPFGASSSGGVFGRLADAFIDILKKKGISSCYKWVDDFLIFRFPSFIDGIPSFAFDIPEIYDIASNLGWPWKDAKTRPFNVQFKYLGFIWSLSDKTVEIPPDKKEKYLARLAPWTRNVSFTLIDAQKTLGTLVHCSLAVPDGRSRLPALARFISSFYGKSPFSRRVPNATVIADILWWRDTLLLSFCGSSLSPPLVSSDASIWVDASSSWGIGLVIDKEWSHWKLRDGWDSFPGQHIGWAEMVAIEIGLLFVIQRGFHDIRLTFRSDNMGVIGGLTGGKSYGVEQNIVLQRIVSTMRSQNIFLDFVYVPSKDNLADPPSRGLPSPGRKRALDILSLHSSLSRFIDNVPI